MVFLVELEINCLQNIPVGGIVIIVETKEEKK